MIRYFANFMGPISKQWYLDRGFTRKGSVVVGESNLLMKYYQEKGLKPGDIWEYDEIIRYCAGGRIDIFGLDPEEYYDGKHEYGVPIMDGEDWGKLSYFLDHHRTETLWTYDELIDAFEKKFLKRKIEWIDE